MKEKLVAALPTMGIAFGMLSNVTGVLGYLNVTPEMIGQTAYGIFYATFPIVMFLSGAVFGWGATKLWYVHKERSIQSRLESLTDLQVLTVVLLYKLGTEATIPSHDVCTSLEEMGLVKKLRGSGGVTVWDLTAETRKAIYSDKMLRNDIEEFEIDPKMKRDQENRSQWVVI